MYFRCAFLVAGVTATLAEENCDLLSIGVNRTLTPKDGSLYDDSREQFASTLRSTATSDAMLSPDAIVYPTSGDELSAIVNFAASCDYKLSIRSGGHQFSGYSSCKAGGSSCIQIDMTSFNSFSLVDGTDNVVTVGVGLRLEEVAPMLQELGLVIPMGHCTKVGVGGHFQTSAAGMLGRAFGLGLDWVLSFRIMTANGQVRTVDRESDAALYNAVLGGAPGSFGIILDYTIEAIKSADHPYSHMFYFFWPLTKTSFSDVSKVYQDIMSTPEVNRDLFLYLTIDPTAQALAAGDVDPHIISLVGVWTGVDNGNLTGTNMEKYIGPFFNITGKGDAPTVVFDTPAPLHVIQNSLLFPFDHPNFRYLQHSVTSSKIADPEYFAMVSDLIEIYDAMPRLHLSFSFQPYGGTGDGTQFNKNAGLNGFPTRSMGTLNDMWIFFEDESQASMIEAELVAFLERSAETEYVKAKPGVETFWIGTQSIYAEEASMKSDYAKYYPNATMFEDLQDVKMRVDPTDVFSSDMTIPLKEENDSVPKPESGSDLDGVESAAGDIDGGSSRCLRVAASTNLGFLLAGFLGLVLM